jgi:membrane protease YdiL (CAAX protease family)
LEIIMNESTHTSHYAEYAVEKKYEGKFGAMRRLAIALYILVPIVVLLILLAWKGGDFWKTQVFTRRKKMNLGLFAVFACLCLASQLVNSFWISGLEWIMNRFDRSVEEILESVSGSSDTVSMFLYASILAPVWEELLFRGYVLRALRPYGKRFAILGSALLFGLFHGNLLQTPYAVVMGLVFGYMTVEYSIVWAILLHMFNNLVLADLLSRLTAQWSEMAFGTLNLILFGGGALISLIILIRNRENIRAYRKSEWMDRRCIRCFVTAPGILAMTVWMCANMILLFA